MRAAEISSPLKFGFWVIPLTILIILPGFVDPINLPKLVVLWVVAFTSVALMFFLRKFVRSSAKSLTRTVAFWLYFAIAASMLISGILGSQNYIRIFFGAPGRNNGLIYYFAVMAIALVILGNALGRVELDYLYKNIAITSILFGFYCSLQFLNLDPVKWSNPYNRVIGTLGNPNFSSAALAIFSVFWMYRAFENSAQSKKAQVLQFSVSFILAFLAWSTRSLQGFVIVIVGFFIVAYIKLVSRVKSRRIPQVVMGGGIALLVFSFSSFIGIGPLGSQLEQYTLKLRATYASIGLKAMLESPMTGIGADNYNSAFRLYRSQEFVAQYGIGLNSDNAHSTPAQIGATFGLLVFSLYLALQFVILVKAFRILNSRDENVRHLKLVAILWLLVFAQSILSIEIIGLGVMNWILGAVILSGIRSAEDGLNERVKSEKSGKTIKKTTAPAWVGSLTILTSLLAASPALYITREDTAYKNVFALQMQNSEEDKKWVRDQFAKLSAFTLDEPSKVSRILENMYNAGMTTEIEQVIKNVYEKNKKDVYANELMATYFRNYGEIDSEIKTREALRKLDPQNFQLELNLARAYFVKKDLIKLKQSVLLVQKLSPNSEEAKSAAQLLAQFDSQP